jgi:hypothetical protein
MFIYVIVNKEVMLARHTPAPVYPIVPNKQLDELQDLHLYEVVTWPAYLPDVVCMNLLRKNTDPNVILFVALMNGITPIMTIGDHKAFIVDLSPPKKSKRKLPKYITGSLHKNDIEKGLKNKRLPDTS